MLIEEEKQYLVAVKISNEFNILYSFTCQYLIFCQLSDIKSLDGGEKD